MGGGALASGRAGRWRDVVPPGPERDEDWSRAMRRALAEAKARSMLSFDELWVLCFSLGGSASVDELRDYLQEDGVLSRTDVNVMTQAFNEHFLDLGQGMPLKYLEL